MHRSTLIALACLRLSSVAAATTPESAILELPDDVQMRIASRLTFPNRARLRSSHPSLAHLWDREAILQTYTDTHGVKAADEMRKDGIGDYVMFKQLLDARGPGNGVLEGAAYAAARNGYTDTLADLKRTYKRLPESAFIGAAERGSIEMVQAVCALVHPSSDAVKRMMEIAVAHDRADFVKFLLNEFKDAVYASDLVPMVEAAAANGNAELVELLKGRAEDDHFRRRFEAAIAHGAAKGGHSNLLFGIDIESLDRYDKEKIYTVAAEHGRVNVMHQLEASEHQPDTLVNALSGAIRNDHRVVFEHLRYRHPDDWMKQGGQAYFDALRSDRSYYVNAYFPHMTMNALKNSVTPAAESGNVEWLEKHLQLYSERVESPVPDHVVGDAMKAAAKLGRIDSVSYMAAKYPAAFDRNKSSLLSTVILNGDPRKVVKTLAMPAIAALDGLDMRGCELMNGDADYRQGVLLASARFPQNMPMLKYVYRKVNQAMVASDVAAAIHLAQKERLGAQVIEQLKRIQQSFQLVQ